MRKVNDDDDSEDEENRDKLPIPNVPLPVMDTKHRYFIGKDYSNAYERDFETLERYSEGKRK